MVLTLMQTQIHHDGGVSRQGGSGVGGGTATGRHHASQPVPSGPSVFQQGFTVLSCDTCGGRVSGVAVVVQRRVYCGDCAVTSASHVPGLYFG